MTIPEMERMQRSVVVLDNEWLPVQRARRKAAEDARRGKS